MDKDTNKNLILALVLSLSVLIGWELLYGLPKMRERQAREAAQREAQVAQTEQTPGSTAKPQQAPGIEAGDAAIPGASTGTGEASEQASAGRLEIKSDALDGSINLRGGRIDELRLSRYHEEVDPKSPVVTLLSPQGTSDPYFVDVGWIAGRGNKVKVPDESTVWTAPEGAELTPEDPVTLTWDNGEGVTFKRTISVDENYLFTVKQDVENKSAAAVNLFPYAQITRVGVPEIADFFVLHEGMVGVLNDELQEIDYSDFEDGEPPQKFESDGGWLGITDKYWAVVLVPNQKRKLQARFGNFPDAGRDVFRADYLDVQGVSIEPGASGSVENNLFAGAKVVELVDGYGKQLGVEKFDLLIDWGWFYFITKPMYHVLSFFQSITGNFGIAILLTTVLIKIIFFPLANKSYVSMSRMKMLQPEMMKIKERYGDDRQKQQQAMMELYKKEKVSPISGCLPVLVQIPVFFALYKVLFGTITMRHEPFFGWIQDLSAPDPTSLFNLFGLIPVDLPQFLIIGVWPILMGITMFVQMKLNPAPPDPIQAKIFTWMPVFFTFLLASFPAGLVIYWAWNNLLSILQQYVIMTRQGVKIELWQNLKETFGLGAKGPEKESE
ncbi:MAG: membrane protein insertase YidC [Hyphomicrobiales bacterium]